MLKRIFGPKPDEVTELRKLCNEELRICRPPDIIWVLKSRRIKWVRHVARLGKWEVHIDIYYFS